MSEEYYIADCQGTLYAEIDGYFKNLTINKNTPVACFVNSISDVETIGELINCCGYTFDSIVDKKVRIIIEEINL